MASMRKYRTAKYCCLPGDDVADFAPDQDCTHVFLTWELPMENANVTPSVANSMTSPPTPGGLVVGGFCCKTRR